MPYKTSAPFQTSNHKLRQICSSTTDIPIYLAVRTRTQFGEKEERERCSWSSSVQFTFCKCALQLMKQAPAGHGRLCSLDRGIPHCLELKTTVHHVWFVQKLNSYLSLQAHPWLWPCMLQCVQVVLRTLYCLICKNYMTILSFNTGSVVLCEFAFDMTFVLKYLSGNSAL